MGTGEGPLPRVGVEVLGLGSLRLEAFGAMRAWVGSLVCVAAVVTCQLTMRQEALATHGAREGSLA